MTDHFTDKVPNFKRDHGMSNPPRTIHPTVQENIDPDDMTRVMPQFVPQRVRIDEAHEIARESSSAARAMLDGYGTMCDFQVDYLQRCIFDSVQQILLGQDAWNWQYRYEYAFARGEVPDPRED